MEKKYVSVIINNYNYGRYLEECIESVLHQTYAEYEIIIVDDGSADESRGIIRSYAEQHPNKITAVFKPNGGQGSALNMGVSISKGDILAFLDSDDYWYPQKLERIVKEHQDHAMVGHSLRKEETFGSASLDYLELEKKNQYFLKEYGFIWFLNTTTSALSFTRGLLEQIFPIPEKVTRVCADTYISLLGVYYEGLCYRKEELGYYRIHDKNQYYGNTEAQRKKNEILFRILQSANRHLISRREAPIPYSNPYLTKDLHEKEEGFIIGNKRYVIYGTGSVARRISEYVVFCGGSIAAYCDSNPGRQGQSYREREIWPPEILPGKREDYDQIIIASTWVEEISGKLRQLGLAHGRDFIYSRIGFWQD